MQESDVYRAYAERRSAAEQEERRLDRQGALLANGRGISFIGALVVAGFTVFHRIPEWGWAVAGVLLLAYVVLAQIHGKVIANEARARTRRELNARGIARLEGRWHEFKEKGESYLTPDHLYDTDLDVFGQGSLFQLVDETATRAGEARLASWLATGATREVVNERQTAARELAPKLDFRQALLVESKIAASEKIDPSRFVAWCEGGPYLDSVRWARPFAWILPAVTATLFVLGQLEVLPGSWWWGGVFALLIVVGLTRKPLGELYEQVTLGERGFVRFGDTFAVAEKERFDSPLLRRVTAPLSGEGEGRASASERLAAFSRAFSFAEARQSSQLHAVLNLLTLWDVHTMFALEKWRRENGKFVRPWFEALAELEALSSLAGLAHDRPQFVFPEVVKEIRLHAEGMGHPLLEKPVLNDVSLPSPKSALLVTGSNMSGKTTLLRAMGANTVLALAGAPVCASRFEVGELRVVTSMRVKDSLERGVSYFYAEVQRIRAVLDAARATGGHALFLLDEILLGTNTRERQIASREILRRLLETGAIGAVTTHDLSLTSLADERWAHIRNVHFRDLLVDGKMAFDYRMREGVVETTNALRVLAEAGVRIDASE